ncbi:MAG: HD domain-containing protein [Candidatus Gastranaerophilales bacterium]|nr:HD domain-containing protein [Candidatus Gastranaerophilales bacterium]
MNTQELIKKYIQDKEHSKRVCALSVLFFEKIKNFFPKLQNFDNQRDLEILKKGAMLHDIGINFEKIYGMPHHKAGAKYIFENKPDDVSEEDLAVISSLIRYHRKSFPNDKHDYYKKLSQIQKAKVQCFGAIIRLMDAFDCFHMNLVENFEVNYDKKLNILTISLKVNTMYNSSLFEAAEKKKNFFEYVFKTKICIGY